MLKVSMLLEALRGLDPDAPVVIGIINSSRHPAADAEPRVCGGVLSLYILCYEEPCPWEGEQPTLSDDGTATLEFDPKHEGSDDFRVEGAPPTMGASASLQVAVVMQQSSLAILAEHTTRTFRRGLPLNETEALVLLTAPTIRRLLDRARPEDTRLDDVISRIGL